MSSDSELQSVVAELQFNNYLSLVIATAVTYDYIITFPKEIHYIWNRPWTAVSFMFLILRYVGLSVALIQGLCTVLLLVYDVAFIIFLVAADAVMILRVYAMYHKSRIVLGVLLVFCPAIIIFYAVSMAFYNNPKTHLIMTNPHVLNMSFCSPTYTTSSKFGRYKLIPRLTLAGLMLILVIARLCTESFQMYKATKRWKASQYLNLLAQEGALYFLVHLLNNLSFGDGTAGSVMTMSVTILLYILSPRFIMNVRELYLRKLLRGNGWSNGIDSGFGLSDDQPPRVLSRSLVGFPDSRTPDMEEGVEMEGIEYTDNANS